jgi:hypothetical protein
MSSAANAAGEETLDEFLRIPSVVDHSEEVMDRVIMESRFAKLLHQCRHVRSLFQRNQSLPIHFNHPRPR